MDIAQIGPFQTITVSFSAKISFPNVTEDSFQNSAYVTLDQTITSSNKINTPVNKSSTPTTNTTTVIK